MAPWNCSTPNPICLYANVRGVRYLEIYCEYGQLLKKQVNQKSYPLKESLKNYGRLLTFYTGLTSMTVFLELQFCFISHSPN